MHLATKVLQIEINENLRHLILKITLLTADEVALESLDEPVES